MPSHLVAPKLPDRFSMNSLEANIAALSKHQPKLVRRMSWPVNSSHTVFGDNGKVGYRLHSSEYELSLSEDQLKTIFSEVGKDRDIFVFGVGLGEVVDFLVDRFSDRKIVAWDRDPWLMRLFLMQRDYSKLLSSGNLRLYMCGDLINLIPQIRDYNRVRHPLLKKIYHNEAGLVPSGVGSKRILMNTGGLFVDDIADSFKELDYTPFYLDLNSISIEEIEYAIIQLMPAFVFSVNYPNGLSEVCKKYSRTLLCWEIDPSIEVPRVLPEKNEKAHIFTYRKKGIKDFLSSGFDHVEYLPLAANMKNRKPVTLNEHERQHYSSPLSFVGSSMLEQAEHHKETLISVYRDYCRNHTIPFDQEHNPFTQVLAIQSRDFSRYQIPDLAQDLLEDFLDFFGETMPHHLDPIMLLAETAASRKRLSYLSGLGSLGLKIWGDGSWKQAEVSGARYMGPAGHKSEINKVYSGTLINLDISRIYQMDMINMRVFDIMACGGLVFAEYSEDLNELFELDKEVVAYRTSDELVRKVKYYLENQDEAKEIAQKGMMSVLERHTIRQRVEYILESEVLQ
ncbi:MAG: glycosyltransferase [Deltaproteobacteria bacterium]|nr:glycosyltransferase [Deltaproteobacteria bacterium]